MKIPGFLSTAYTATASAVSNFYGWGSSACSSLARKVGQVAGRFIPTAVSNTVQAYPKSFACISGGAIVGTVGSIAFKYFHNQGLERKLEGIRAAIKNIDINNKDVAILKTECLSLIT
ncbi:MAG: hypothetical protein WBD50_03675 [Candidatus Rhabdochlamydia sp.]